MNIRNLLVAVVSILLTSLLIIGVPRPLLAQNTQILVGPDWLRQNLGREGLVVIDLRQKSDYLRGHIPGAVNLSLADITETTGGVRGMLAGAEKIARVFSNLGIDDSSIVIIYDLYPTSRAARLFWALEYTGHKNAKLLNGGFQYWVSKGFPLSREAVKPVAASYQVRERKELLVTKAYLLSKPGDPGVSIVDSRMLKEYQGGVVRAARGGHIPGAVNIDWTNNLAAGTALFRPAKELKELYEAAGVAKDKEVVTYCQTGVRASHTYFTLRFLGYPRVRVYDGSWEEWGNDPALPIQPGS